MLTAPAVGAPLDLEVLVALDAHEVDDLAAGAVAYRFATRRDQLGHQPVQAEGDDHGNGPAQHQAQEVLDRAAGRACLGQVGGGRGGDGVVHAPYSAPSVATAMSVMPAPLAASITCISCLLFESLSAWMMTAPCGFSALSLVIVALS